MIKPFLLTVIAIAGLCTAASASVVDYRDYDRDKHHDRKFDDHGYNYGDDGRDHHDRHDHHDFSWDDKWYGHDDRKHHHDYDFRWWLIASSSGFDHHHDHWWFDDHGKYCYPGDPGGGVSAVPLPPALSLFGGALLLLGALAWRRRMQKGVSC